MRKYKNLCNREIYFPRKKSLPFGLRVFGTVNRFEWVDHSSPVLGSGTKIKMSSTRSVPVI